MPVCLRIEEKHRFSQNSVQNSQFKAFFVENSYKPNPKQFKRHGFNKNKFTKNPSFSEPKNNFSYNNNKNKDKNMGNEMFCFVCGQTNHLAKNCFQCNIPKEYYENLINKIQDKIKNAFIKTIFQKHGKFKTLISLS